MITIFYYYISEEKEKNNQFVSITKTGRLGDWKS